MKRIADLLSREGNLRRVPSLLMQKLPAWEFASLAICNSDVIRRCRLKGHNQVVADFSLEPGPVHLRVDVDENAVCRFSFAVGDKDSQKIETPFVAKEGGWIGAKRGIHCSSDSRGYADFDFFTILPGTARGSGR